MKRLRKAFTLIELLVVIAIIGILATVVIINVSNARTKATRSTIQSNLGVAVRAYGACESFATTPTMNPTAAEITAGTKVMTPGAVCSGGTFQDNSESTASVGAWPTVPTGYAYVAMGANNLVKVQYGSDTNATVTCTKVRCTPGTAW